MTGDERNRSAARDTRARAARGRSQRRVVAVAQHDVELGELHGCAGGPGDRVQLRRLQNELVTLIAYQRAYSANAKTVQTADQMLQEIDNLKQ